MLRLARRELPEAHRLIDVLAELADARLDAHLRDRAS
jgi:hypothetical protein